LTAGGVATDANGALSGSGLTKTGTGTYVLAAGSPTAVSAALAALTFTPTAHQVTPGQAVTTGVTIAVSNNGGTPVTNTATSIVATAVNDAPAINGVASSKSTNDETPITPFTGATITSPDVGVTETVKILVSTDGWATETDANGVFTGSGLTKTGAGSYTLTGSPAAVTAQLQALAFTPTAHQVTPGQTTTTGVIVLDYQGNQSVGVASYVNVTAVNDAPKITGTLGGQVTSDYLPIKPFSTAVISDVDVGVTDGLTITLKNASGAATDANGSLSGSGLTKTGTGTYTLSGAPGTLTQQLQALSFTPTQHEVGAGATVTTSFTLAATQNVGGTTTSATDTTTSVTTTALNYINGSGLGASLLFGTSGADVINAFGSFNTIYGNGGNDYINATSGGYNTFVLPAAGSGFETISGFSEGNGDIINLLTPLQAAGWNVLQPVGNYLKVTNSGSTTTLSIAAGGSGSGVALAVLTGAGGYALPDLQSHLVL
jgi:plastocyanin